MGDVKGKEFMLTGWGLSGAIREDGDEDHLEDEIFHRGYNFVDDIQDNLLVYDFDRPEDAHALEALGHQGDSGSGAFIDVDGTLYVAGVESHGDSAFYGAVLKYVRVGGLNQPWIEANLDSPDTKVSVENCSAFPGFDGEEADQGDSSSWND